MSIVIWLSKKQLDKKNTEKITSQAHVILALVQRGITLSRRLQFLGDKVLYPLGTAFSGSLRPPGSSSQIKQFLGDKILFCGFQVLVRTF